MKQLLTLFTYNVHVEYRRRAQSLALVLFSWIVTYILYRVHQDLTMMEFGYMYWMFMLLLSVNVCVRAESHHGSGEHIFLYSCADPTTILLAKFLFNFVYLLLMGCFFYGFFLLYFSAELSLNMSFLPAIAVGAVGISTCLSFVASISTYTSGQNTLISILALPLLIPIILILKTATDEIILFDNIEYLKYLTVLSISLLTLALSLVLFPNVWRE